MSQTVICAENLSKSYQLGVIGTGTFYGDVKRWWAKQRGKPDPYLKVGEADHGNRDGETIWALKDVNFSVQQGEALGIIGRNGAGKSTLLKILSQVTSPTSGVLKVKGRIASLLEVGTGFHPELTGRENIFLNGAIMGMRKVEIAKNFDEIVSFAEIEKFIDTPVKRYSSGMYVRLAFAVAAHLEPDLLIVDEVLAVGDIAFQRRCLSRMNDVSRVNGRTVLLVSHNMAAIMAICSRALLLEAGVIISSGSAPQVVAEYQSKFASKTASHVKLDEISLRWGPGSISRLISISIFNGDGVPSSSFQMGQCIIVRVQVRFSKYVEVPEVGIAVSNLMGQRLSHVVSTWEGFTASAEPGEYIYEVKLPNVNFIPGRYTLTVWVKREGQLTPGSDDGIESPVTFEITAADISGSLPAFDRYCQPGETYMKSYWSRERAW
jgi:lipopolysaccharide transport system ATP-binding protein